jgi:hypothetical protein
MTMLCDDNLLNLIRYHEANAMSVKIVSECEDILFRLPDGNCLAVPWPVYAEYCQRMRSTES